MYFNKHQIALTNFRNGDEITYTSKRIVGEIIASPFLKFKNAKTKSYKAKFKKLWVGFVHDSSLYKHCIC